LIISSSGNSSSIPFLISPERRVASQKAVEDISKEVDRLFLDKETFEKDIEEWGRTLYPNQDIKDYPTIKLLSRAMINYYLLNYL